MKFLILCLSEDCKYYPQIYLEEWQYHEMKAKKKKRQIKGKIMILDKNESDVNDDKSTE